MISTIKRRYTLNEYRALEEKAEGRSEYRDGEIVPMPAGTLKYIRLTNLIYDSETKVCWVKGILMVLVVKSGLTLRQKSMTD
ncbi:MAG: hypothetical protein C4323_25720 [Mastigocladus sp. ERB_26_2]